MKQDHYDLHCHSHYSDGTDSIQEIIQKAEAYHLAGVALTDHDTLDGVDELSQMHPKFSVIKGIELSTYYREYPVHLLGYFYENDARAKTLREYTEESKQLRIDRSKEILRLLKTECNILLSYQELQVKAKNIITRPHIANCIAAKYNVPFQDCFDRFLGNDRPAYVPIDRLSTQDGLKLLKENNAFVSVAHPKFYDEVIDEIIYLGVDGIEVNHPSQGKMQRGKYRHMAKYYNLQLTGGSDYHGHSSPHDLGSSNIQGTDAKRFLKKVRLTNHSK